MPGYAFKTLQDREEIEKLWNEGHAPTPKELAERTGKSLSIIYAELSRGRDGSRLPDQRIAYSATLAQSRVQQSLERRGHRAAKV